ncbi:hypothetical protein KM043_016899, partial [Ampulex compressa]
LWEYKARKRRSDDSAEAAAERRDRRPGNSVTEEGVIELTEHLMLIAWLLCQRG